MFYAIIATRKPIMSRWKRLLFYLALNILVSAVTTLLVLVWWDRTHRSELPVTTGQPVVSAPASAGSAVPLPSAKVTLPPLSQPVIEIKNVYGVGDLQNEVVVLQRSGDGELALANWKLKDDDGHTFTFPDLVLNKGGAVQVYSRAGTDTVIELYWSQNSPIWQTGEQVTLVDPLDQVRATYTIP